MLIERLRAKGLLSFGPSGIDLPLGSLNVLIGPNGSGKSNLLEVLALLRAAPTFLPAPVKAMGGIAEWLWKGLGPAGSATVEAFLPQPSGKALHHLLELTSHGERFELVDEQIEDAGSADGEEGHYRYRRGRPVLREWPNAAAGGPPLDKPFGRAVRPDTVKPEESILSQVRDPERYPALYRLQAGYEAIRLYRSWSFGPSTAVRRSPGPDERSDFLSDGGENLALVLSTLRRRVKGELLAALRLLFDGIEDFQIGAGQGSVALYLEEEEGRTIPASRLSDGTLRYLALLAILLHPEPPPLVAIEEPELGLHPDILPSVADLLLRASERMQIVVTTHSRMLVDALSEHAEHIVVCTKERGETRFERLSADGDMPRGWSRTIC